LLIIRRTDSVLYTSPTLLLMPLLIHSLKDFPNELRGGAVAIGNFDGVHRGHCQLVRELVAQAQRLAAPAIVFTFDPPPVAILFPQRTLSAPLTDIDRRAELLHKLGVDLVLAYPTDMALLRLTAEEFFQKVLLTTLGARAIVEGPNFRFGHDRIGDVAMLNRLCKDSGLSLAIVPASNDEAGMISSTRVRELINAGNIAGANELLTQPYQIVGQVGHGASRGQTLGSPTANLNNIHVLVPPHGVYAGYAPIGDAFYPAAIHIGPNPTFGDDSVKVEVHLIDWSGELYGAKFACIFLNRLRDVRKFDSRSELQTQIALDIEACRTIFKKYAPMDR
jgi:riboflavin kinase/FMN adenylyltransferase